MVFVPGGTFRMDSDDHYAEEAPAHLVTASAVWIDRRQVTNADRAAFVTATGYTTVAERELGPADFPGAPIENLARGSLVFAGTRGPVDLRDLMQWWTWTSGRAGAPRSVTRNTPVLFAGVVDREPRGILCLGSDQSAQTSGPPHVDLGVNAAARSRYCVSPPKLRPASRGARERR
ncbi:hypothetical protein E3O67_06485 [Cryobacterium sp. TMT3-29-2]|nr:SUMF1/EgtB/PvdO family nonheme iron enzyme [Cryobacterium sp. TMT3-29-2]TFC89856.1 hypothetical protein E3O67_06485 [Cryobacterium sp. TMT3-29-2]